MGRHILIVDDNEPICEVIRDMLEMEGYETTIRSTGKDTVPFIQQLQPDLILLDVMLDEGIDGRDICKAVKSLDTIGRIPIVMVSATHNLEDAVNGYCKPDAFLAKPFDMYVLIHTVEQQLTFSGHPPHSC